MLTETCFFLKFLIPVYIIFIKNFKPKSILRFFFINLYLQQIITKIPIRFYSLRHFIYAIETNVFNIY